MKDKRFDICTFTEDESIDIDNKSYTLYKFY